MKKFWVVLFLISALSATGTKAFGSEPLDSLWDSANTLYINGNYREAIDAYQAIASQGYSGAKLFYNLGNACFKDNRLGKAIVNYNRASRLAPADKDIKYNLAVADSYIKDRIEPVPELFVSGWVRKVRGSLGSNSWAAFSLIALVAIAACVLVYVLSQNRRRRKAGFFGAAILSLLFMASISFAAAEKRRVAASSGAVVLSVAVSVKSSPEESGKELFIIHEGTRVDVESRLGDWVEVVIANGNKGWLHDSAIEYI